MEKQNETSTSHHDHHLPQEIVEQIMIKLPTKSILRFNSFSKSWRSIASSDRFIKAHLEKSSSKHGSLERHHITFTNYRRHPHAKKKKYSLPSLLYGPAARDDDTAVADFNYPTCAPEDSADIVGSCNGLLCVLKNEKDFILWNPTTQKFRNLPPALDDAELNDLTSDGSRFLFAEAYGFCFDESDGDYKVFGTWRRTPRPNDGERKLLAKMYSSKTDSSRRVDHPVLDSVFEFSNTEARFASGKLYWEAYRTDDDEGLRIISFYVENEAFGAVEWPGGLGEQGWFLGHVIDGSLCCFNTHSCTQPDHIDYWVLKEGPCWHKFATLGRPCLVADEIEFDGDGDWFFTLFAVPGDGDILAEHYNGYVVVFAKEEEGGYSGPRVVGSEGNFCHTSIYVESLVEP